MSDDDDSSLLGGMEVDEGDEESPSDNESEEFRDIFMMIQGLEDEAIAASASAIVTLEDVGEEEEERTWGGSLPGKSPNKKRDFAAAHQRLVGQYFLGEKSVCDEKDFERRFRMPRHVFHRLWSTIEGQGPFVQKFDCLKKPGISPLVCFTACLRKQSRHSWQMPRLSAPVT